MKSIEEQRIDKIKYYVVHILSISNPGFSISLWETQTAESCHKLFEDYYKSILLIASSMELDDRVRKICDALGSINKNIQLPSFKKDRQSQRDNVVKIYEIIGEPKGIIHGHISCLPEESGRRISKYPPMKNMLKATTKHETQGGRLFQNKDTKSLKKDVEKSSEEVNKIINEWSPNHKTVGQAIEDNLNHLLNIVISYRNLDDKYASKLEENSEKMQEIKKITESWEEWRAHRF